MPIIYDYIEKSNIIAVRARGILTISELEEYTWSLLNEEGVKDNFIEVVDLEEVSDFNFSFQNGCTIYEHYFQLKKLKKLAGSVYFAPEQIHYGISHVISTILDNINELIITRDKNEVEAAVKNFRDLINF